MTDPTENILAPLPLFDTNVPVPPAGEVSVCAACGVTGRAMAPEAGTSEVDLHAREVRPVEPAEIPARSFRSGHFVDELFAWLRTVASAAVYATLLVTFGFQVARVDGQSMAPTLADHDRVIVNKAAYQLHDPQVGDIVMLYYPLNPDKCYVKRVIASGGDRVRVVGGKVYRNDVQMDDSFVQPDYRSHDDWGPRVIPEGHYFVMGDHRNNSADSRHWGYVPKRYVVGKVQSRWWPLPTARLF